MKAPFFLKSTKELNGTFFENAILLITETNDKGATGFVINMLFPRKLNDLTEFSHAQPFPLNEGGPVDREHLFVLHHRPDLIAVGEPVGEGLYLGGDMNTIIEAINNDTLTTADIRLFIGYCGWDNDELQNEISEGSWEISSGEKLF